MLRNYFKIAWRSLSRNKGFSLINILGLSIGISVCFIITIFVKNELSYDRFNVKADRIFRIVFKANINGGKINEANVMPPVAAALTNDYPEVEEATRLLTLGFPRIIYGDKTFKESQVVAVDPNFFDVFTLPFVNGDAKSALKEPNTIVLTQAMAKQIFGNEDAIGKLIKINGDVSYKVTGVIKEIPVNSHFHFDLFTSMAGVPDAREDSWLSSNFFTYLVLKKGYDYKLLEAKFPGMVEKYMGPQIQQAMGMSLAQFRTKGNELGFALQPLTDIHFQSDSNAEFEPGGDRRYVYIFGAVAVFMLLIACINFINLSTASASSRAKEVGIRKTMGSAKGALIRQFLFESILVTFIALIISVLFIKLGLPVFNRLSGKHLVFDFDLTQLLIFLGIGVAVGFIAGTYPAFFLSSFKPIETLKGKFVAGNKSFTLRSGLVVFQFFISVSLIASTLIVYRQMNFIRNKKLGYDKDHLLVLSNSYLLDKNEELFKQQLLTDRRITNATMSGYLPAGPSSNNNALAYPAGNENQVLKAVEYHIDEQYIPTLGIEMAAGRNFSATMPTDSLGMIINESAARVLGWGKDAVGHEVVRENSVRGTNVKYTVIGIVKDFHFRSLHEAISPLFMVLQPEMNLIVRINTKDISGLLGSMKQLWAKFNPGEPFSYSFMDELYDRTYSTEQKTGSILTIFAVLTILVACMGLFGLATYTAAQRSREIGIRKVLGANTGQITQMLSKDFLRLVLIACVIAIPLSYFAMNKWLQDFAYRTDLSWWIFMLACVLAVCIALFTVSFQAIRAALANPVKSLRSE